MKRFGRLLGAAIVVGAAMPASAPAQTKLDDPPATHGVRVSADGGMVAWSREVGKNRFRLVIRERGRTRLAPVRARSVPFDVDLGPGPDGRIVAVYSRCRREPQPGGRNWLPAWSDGRGCDVYLYDPKTRRERRLGVSRRDASEYMPSIWRTRIAFARRWESRGRPRTETRIVVAPLKGRGRKRSLSAGSGLTEHGTPAVVRSLDLAGRRLVYDWTADLGQIRLVTLGGGRRVIEAIEEHGDPSTVHSPVIDGGHVYYAGSSYRGETHFFARYSIRTGRIQRARASLVTSFARDRGFVFYSGFAFNPPGLVMAPQLAFR